MAIELHLRDVLGLYPFLQVIARFDETDVGDNSSWNAPPYRIAPRDMDTYITLRDISHLPWKLFSDMHPPPEYDLFLNGNILNPLEMVELYRQLTRYDKSDDYLDGMISADLMEKKVYLPSTASGFSFWGNNWTPARRLGVFTRFYAARVDALIKSYEGSEFPLGRAYTAGIANAPTNISKLRTLYSGEKRYIGLLAQKIEPNFPEYAGLIRQAMPTARVVEGYISNITEQAEIEPAPFGLTPLFNEDKIGVYLLIYPQFGQMTIDAPRGCIPMRTRKGWKRKCLPSVGSSSRERVINTYLRPYTNQATLVDYDNLRLYMEMSRVRNLFRYRQAVSHQNAVHQMIIHEILHYRNLTRPADDKFSVHQMTDLLNRQHRGEMTSYSDYHKLGYILTHMQRITFEEAEKLRQELSKPISKATFKSIKERLQFIGQLHRLAKEAEENLIDGEVWRIYYNNKPLKAQPWTFAETEEKEMRLIFNRHEIELIRRQP